MADFVYHYDDRIERAQIIEEQEKKKLRMVHDTFDPDWKPGGEQSGNLIFTDINPPLPALIDWKAKYALATSTEKVKIVAQILGLEEI